MNEVQDHIFALGEEIIYIPAHCTSLAQPLDVGVNKPFKDRIRQKWKDWFEEEKRVHGEAYYPKTDRPLVARWIIDTNLDIDAYIGRNAWLHAPYNYFDIEE